MFTVQRMMNGWGFAYESYVVCVCVCVCACVRLRKGTEALKAFCSGLHDKFPRCQHWEGNVMITPGSKGTCSLLLAPGYTLLSSTRTLHPRVRTHHCPGDAPTQSTLILGR